MKVEFTKEPNFSKSKCIKLIAESSAEEAQLDEFFEEDLNLGEIDIFTDGEQTKSGFRDVTMYKKLKI